jgi:hypothetical protein
MVAWPYVLGYTVAGADDRGGSSPHDEQEVKIKERDWDQETPSKARPCNSLPPARPHFIKLPHPPKIAPLAGNQASTQRPVGDISYSSHNT